MYCETKNLKCILLRGNYETRGIGDNDGVYGIRPSDDSWSFTEFSLWFWSQVIMKETGGIILVVLFRSYLEPYSTHPCFNDLFFDWQYFYTLYTGGNTSLVIFYLFNYLYRKCDPSPGYWPDSNLIRRTSECHRFLSLAKLVTSLDKLNVLWIFISYPFQLYLIYSLWFKVHIAIFNGQLQIFHFGKQNFTLKYYLSSLWKFFISSDQLLFKYFCLLDRCDQFDSWWKCRSFRCSVCNNKKKV